MKKHYDYPKNSLSGRSLRRFLMMTFLFYSIASSAGVQSATFDVNFEKSSLEQVVTFLKEKSSYDFVYRKGMLPSDVQVSLKLRDATVEEVLEKSLPQGLSFEISNKVVVISNVVSQQSPTAARAGGFVVSGTVYEQRRDGTKDPLSFVTVTIPDYSISTLTDEKGNYRLHRAPSAQLNVVVRALGKVTIDTLINVRGDMNLDFTMREDNFRLEEVIVNAENNRPGEATSSVISRAAIDHIQATSLKDVLALLPGGILDSKSLNSASRINIRGLGEALSSGSTVAAQDAINMNAMGVSIIQDGSPLSNNANLQSMNPTVATSGAGAGSHGGSAGPTGGIDARGISMENVESVEIIRGIPSVKFGDASSGVIIINSKAGREPLRANARLTANITQFALGGGYNLGGRAGALNFNADYTHNILSVVRNHVFYDRYNGKLLYSNGFFNNKWTTNTSLTYGLQLDKTKNHRDNKDKDSHSYGEAQTFKFSTNGIINLDWGWFRNINYVFSVNHTARDSYSQGWLSNATAPYTGSMTDGSILSSKPGADVYDADGNKITNIPHAETNNYAYMTPDSYLGKYRVEGREFNYFGSVNANFLKLTSTITNRILIGADFRSDGNTGRGTMFERDAPPNRTTYAYFSSYRERPFSDIPFVNQLGLFAEENFSLRLGKRHFNLQAGVRYDHVSVVGGLVAPRVNAAFDIFPGVTVRGGYGLVGKMPTVLMLHPQDAYFEFQNINTMGNADEALREFVVTTRIFDARNKNLEIAVNRKSELGLDIRYGQYSLGITAYNERMNNGYTFSTTIDTYKLVNVVKYALNADNEFARTGDYNTFVRYSTPANNSVSNSKGLEFILNLGRFDAIRTSFIIDGAWTCMETYDKGYSFSDRATGAGEQSHVGVYQQAMEKRYYERLVTTLRVTHNIPHIGFVVTLTGQVIWKEADWYRYNGEKLPIMYISKIDGKLYDFPADYDTSDSNFSGTIRSQNANYYKDVSYGPVACFNLNLTKEIGNVARISFFAQNALRYYQIVDNQRTVGSQLSRNPSFFFGLEMSLFIR